MRRNKYGVASKPERTSRDGIVFDSKGELARWEKLRLWQLAGEIRKLRRQVEYPLIINGITVGKFTADFVYERLAPVPCDIIKSREGISAPDRVKPKEWLEVIEDFKGTITRDASFRIKVFNALYGKDVLITKA